MVVQSSKPLSTPTRITGSPMVLPASSRLCSPMKRTICAARCSRAKSREPHPYPLSASREGNRGAALLRVLVLEQGAIRRDVDAQVFTGFLGLFADKFRGRADNLFGLVKYQILSLFELMTGHSFGNHLVA